jgi:diguanylate cyclase (GGDEF)-like protein
MIDPVSTPSGTPGNDWSQRVLEQLPCQVYVKDVEGRYLYANACARTRLGQTQEGLIGRSDRDLLPADEAERREAADLAALQGAVAETSAAGEWRMALRASGDALGAAEAVLALIGLPSAAVVATLPALTDTLTGLPNDSLLFERIAQAQQRSRRSGSFAVLLYLEIDQLDTVRGQHGHAAAERVQFEVAQRLREAMRAVDTVARVGDGRFVLLGESVGLDQAQGIEFSAELKRRIDRQLEEGCTFGGLSIDLRARSGSMLFRGLDPAPSDLLETVVDIMRQRED